MREAGCWQVPVFVTVRQARVYVRRRGRKLATSEANTLELCRVQRWLEDPVRRKTPPGSVLEAWNFFEDLARGVDAVHQLPQQGTVQNSAYVKLKASQGCPGPTPLDATQGSKATLPILGFTHQFLTLLRT